MVTDEGGLALAIADAHRVGLHTLARHYQRFLDAEKVIVINTERAFDLLVQADEYGVKVAQKAHRDNPHLSLTSLQGIALNASNWYGNSRVLDGVLANATKRSGGVYEVVVKNGKDLDQAAYNVYRGISVGARRTAKKYSGKEGLHELPGPKGKFDGGIVGLRRAAETSGKKSPAIDINTPKTGPIKIHFRH